MSKSVPESMDRYLCHKEVRALKIRNVNLRPPMGFASGSATIVFEKSGVPVFVASPEFMKRHDPRSGGYLVVYKDGYMSFSPAEAFEDGYGLMEGGD